MFYHGDVKFKKLERCDLPILENLKNDSWMSTHQVTISNSEDQERWFASLCSNVNVPRSLVLTAAIRCGDHFPKFGIFKIFDIDYVNGTANVGWDVLHGQRGKGYGKQLVNAGCAFCFDILSLRRLTAEILANNIASLRCAQFAGFAVEGTKRKAVHRLGEYIDSVVLGLLFSDRNLDSQPKIRAEQ